MAYTPRGDSIAIGDLNLQDNGSDEVPWPGNTYIIQDRRSKRSIYSYNGISMTSGTGGYSHWLCVESRGYFGFFNKENNQYLSFQNDRIQMASDFGSRELFSPRRHPMGGYLLMVPHGSDTLKQVGILCDETTLVARHHAGAIWDFIQVSELR
ncbi:hypothetical protein CI102_12966 [Trichoderma harzianum]|uniref:Uncharacterized protein n=1 Tax=Trichoderma harzianum CBS 226.95 TaxID=983964 RepID=A0A2T4AJW0_TRIHA|nr:hypothetical protein M431DRAFT_78907 [Trichoderma harzianum CBS 226.95]PKK42225.1 hypothetical protein CI102_12966 [Trichoderma harzianum]PTB57365.1 hypothetical protein M431DRAFT_78907 [Trichoderma harzianum CBS 226.95]